MEGATGEEAEVPGWGGACLLWQWGPAGSCGVLLRVGDKIPLAAAGWGREAGAGAAELGGRGLPEVRFPEGGRKAR